MTKIVTVLGARPQFIKAAAVTRTLSVMADVEETLIHTGQHFDSNMSHVFFEELNLPQPHHHLGINGAGHGVMTGRMLQKLEPLLQALRPDWVLVYGDTNSTLAGALAAAKLHLPVAHVEAGLRSFNRRMPEELNRIVTDHLADRLFTPTDVATANLAREGIPDHHVQQVGDVMYDVCLFYGALADARSGVLSRLNLQPQDYVLATVHRAENTDDPLRLAAIVQALEAVAERWPVILPLHPRTRAALTKAAITLCKVTAIEPVGYLDMVALERSALVIATDSGGVQKEAYFHRVPCVTLRDETEWVELLDLGWNRLAPPHTAAIAEIVLGSSNTQGRAGNPYGDGHAAERIVDTFKRAM